MSRSVARLARAQDVEPAQRKLLTLAMLSALVLGLTALAGCNTMDGMGQDMEAAGEAVSESARETQEGM